MANKERKLPDGKITVDDLLADVEVAALLNKTHQKISEIVDIVVVMILKSGKRLIRTTMNVDATISNLERAKLGVMLSLYDDDVEEESNET